jgi:AAA15 family ATPase/GTPase
MFIEFQIKNFRSFKDLQKLTMRAAPLRPNDDGMLEGNVFTSDNFRLLKSKAIYGGNASGKSNISRAFASFVEMVEDSVAFEGISHFIWNQRFLLSAQTDEPVSFQYIFLLNKKIFRYGFEIKDAVVVNEWLYGSSNVNKEEKYFTREGGLSIDKTLFKGAELYIDQAMRAEGEVFRPDALFLTGAALNNVKLAVDIRNAIKSIFTIDGIDDEGVMKVAMRYLEKATDGERESFKKLLNSIDPGIVDFELRDRPKSSATSTIKPLANEKSKELFSIHSVFDDNGTLSGSVAAPFALWASQGTSRFFGIAVLLLESLNKGLTIIFDEFDARFHPNLTLKIVELFHSQTTNPHNAQLIFITHDTGLLRRAELRRDQIGLVTKDRHGISKLRTLIEYKGVRKDASYEKEYLQGNYGATPYLDDMDLAIIQNLSAHGSKEAE